MKWMHPARLKLLTSAAVGLCTGSVGYLHAIARKSGKECPVQIKRSWVASAA